LISPRQGTCSLTCYRSDQIEAIWPKVEGYIKKGLALQDYYCAEDLLEGLCNSSMQLWCWQDDENIYSACVTTIQFDANDKWCLILCMGGSDHRIDEWAPRVEIIEAWAKMEGCSRMEIYGRIGWARKLNYKVEYTKLSKGI
jgi:hypothetical protein